MELAIQFQILNKVVCASLWVNTLGNGTNLLVLDSVNTGTDWTLLLWRRKQFWRRKKKLWIKTCFTHQTNWPLITSYPWLILPSRLGLQNILTAPLQRSKTFPLMSVLDMRLNNLMVRFQWCWGFGEYREPTSLPLLPGPLWSSMVVPDRALSMR